MIRYNRVGNGIAREDEERLGGPGEVGGCGVADGCVPGGGRERAEVVTEHGVHVAVRSAHVLGLIAVAVGVAHRGRDGLNAVLVAQSGRVEAAGRAGEAEAGQVLPEAGQYLLPLIGEPLLALLGDAPAAARRAAQALRLERGHLIRLASRVPLFVFQREQPRFEEHLGTGPGPVARVVRVGQARGHALQIDQGAGFRFLQLELRRTLARSFITNSHHLMILGNASPSGSVVSKHCRRH